MKVLIGCEYSGIVREEFKKRGHDAWSCDLLQTEIPGNHYQCDIRDLDLKVFDLLIAHPPCTYLAVSGAKWFKEPKRQEKQKDALEFVRFLMNAPVNKICIENPVSIISTRIRKPDKLYILGNLAKMKIKLLVYGLKTYRNWYLQKLSPKYFVMALVIICLLVRTEDYYGLKHSTGLPRPWPNNGDRSKVAPNLLIPGRI